MDTHSPTTETAVLGGGCFWCTEAVYQQVKGVTAVVAGYAGGETPSPSYYEVESGKTGHAQVVQLSFDPMDISYADILDIFWVVHDPTTRNRQDYDMGPQYRSIILYNSPEQQKTAIASKEQAQKLYDNPIVTEIAPLKEFFEAEAGHQNYYRSHPELAYCQIIINPKLAKLRAKFHARLKDGVQET